MIVCRVSWWTLVEQDEDNLRTVLLSHGQLVLNLAFIAWANLFQIPADAHLWLSHDNKELLEVGLYPLTYHNLNILTSNLLLPLAVSPFYPQLLILLSLLDLVMLH